MSSATSQREAGRGRASNFPEGTNPGMVTETPTSAPRPLPLKRPFAWRWLFQTAEDNPKLSKLCRLWAKADGRYWDAYYKLPNSDEDARDPAWLAAKDARMRRAGRWAHKLGMAVSDAFMPMDPGQWVIASGVIYWRSVGVIWKRGQWQP